MNAVDKILLELLLAELMHARVCAKDLHADALIRRTLEQHPDAAYALVQRVLQLESALCAARAAAAEAGSSVAARPETGEGEHKRTEPWWRQPVDVLAGTVIVAQSAAYLLGAGGPGPAPRSA